MDTLVGEIFSQYGPLGVLVIIALYLIYINFQGRKDKKAETSALSNTIDKMADKLDGQIRNIREYIETERTVLEKSINLTEEKITLVSDTFNKRMDDIECKLKNQPKDIADAVGVREMKHKVEHNQRMITQLQIGPQLHKILSIYREKIKYDHIFIATFHNGTESLSGVPYYKFDMIAEKFRPDKISRDVEFCHMYKDADLMKHDKLPIILIQQEQLHYIIDENKNSELRDVDDIIYRRMVGRDIKQLSIRIFKDKLGRPSGFVGGIRYDYEELDNNELSNLSREIEEIFNKIS